MTKIANWNVNSINARLEIFLDWVKNLNPDVICLQELKCVNEAFPHEIVENLGYNIAVNGQKTYNGVAILSKYPIEEVNYSFDGNPDDSQKRYIEAVISVNKKIHRVISVYVPNGQDLQSDKYQYKLKFLENLFLHSQKLLKYEERIIMAGDYNIAPEDIDVYDSANMQNSLCFSLEEKIALRKFLFNGYHDAFRSFNQDKQVYSWWDYRAGAFQKNQGLRIDHFLVNSLLLDEIAEIYYDIETRKLQKTSDHAPHILVLQN